MDLNTVFSDYWELLNLCEDYLKGGYRTDHQPTPAFHFDVKSAVQESPSDAFGQDHAPAEENTASASPSSATIPVQSGSLDERILGCRRCDLHLARKQPIPGRGATQPKLVVVLPPPGYDEDDQNLPLTGEAEDFLNKWLGAVGVTPEEVYLTNAVKCRTPGTRPPFPVELEACSAFLTEQIEALKPQAVLLLGEGALHSVERSGVLSQKRGQPFFINSRFYLATYDPAQVLVKADLKRPAWEDLKVLRDFLNHG
ncbi:MAG: uracil-DNA glycosylase [Spirochaetales bacterium]|nr:uracil-DNA glycosylase [Spirochaetales bacterium]